MSEKKNVICCGSSEQKTEGVNCRIENTDKGVTISITSDDPKTVEKLRAMSTSCCCSSDSNCC